MCAYLFNLQLSYKETFNVRKLVSREGATKLHIVLSVAVVKGNACILLSNGSITLFSQSHRDFKVSKYGN